MNNLRFSTLLLLVALVLFTGCAPGYLKSDSYRENEQGFKLDENSEISDTATNRAILDVLARYRNALVKKDIGTIKSLVSSDYYENSGTTDTTADDYGASDLPAVFELMAQHTDEIKYDVTVKDVVVNANEAYIDYEFQYAYHFFIDGKPSWDAGVDLNRLKLSKTNGKWKIISGL